MNSLGRISLLLGALVLVVFGVVCLKQQFGSTETPSSESTGSELATDFRDPASQQPTVLSVEPYPDHNITYGDRPPELSPVPVDANQPEPFSLPVNATLPEVPRERPAYWGDVHTETTVAPSGYRTAPAAIAPAPAEFIPSSHDKPLTATVPEKTTTVADDSLWKIAERAYGRGEFYKALFLHNRALLPRPDRIPAGIEIATPSIEDLRLLYPNECPPE